MAGMLQIITYLLSFYLIINGIEVLQIGLASNNENKTGIIIFGSLVLVVCIIAAAFFVNMQDQQAMMMQKPGNP